MARKKLTPTQEAYNKEYNRIVNFIKRAEKRGFMFNFNAIIPKKLKHPKRASVERLKNFKPADLYEHSVYGGLATEGEITTGTEGRKAENKARAIKSAQTRQKNKLKPFTPLPMTGFTVPDKINTDKLSFSYIVIRNYRDMIKTFPKVAYPILSQWLDDLISEYGEWETALMLDEGLRSGLVLTKEIAYDENKLQDYMADMENYLGLDTERRKQLTDALESDENFTVY